MEGICAIEGGGAGEGVGVGGRGARKLGFIAAKTINGGRIVKFPSPLEAKGKGGKSKGQER